MQHVCLTPPPEVGASSAVGDRERPLRSTWSTDVALCTHTAFDAMTLARDPGRSPASACGSAARRDGGMMGMVVGVEMARRSAGGALLACWQQRGRRWHAGKLGVRRA